MKKFYVVDVSSMFFRAFYAIRPLTNPQGLPVNAVYGFLSMIVKLLKDEKPDYFVFCYDQKEPSFRKELFDDYKANRTEMPEDLAVQIPYIKRLATALGIPALEVKGFEADDLIGTLAVTARKHGCEVYIVSGDKDFAQLVTDKVFLFDTMKNIKYGPLQVKEKWGLPPEQMRDYLSLVGDSSDNIPGVAGIGPKGALKLLEQFSSLENLYQNLDKIESKSIREKLEKSKEMAFLSQQLVTIVTDVEVHENLSAYERQPLQREELRALLNELNFKTFEKILLSSEETSGSTEIKSTSTAPASTVEISATSLPVLKQSQQSVFALDEASLDVKELQDLRDLKTDAAIYIFLLKDVVYLMDTTTQVYRFNENSDFKKQFETTKIRWIGFDLKQIAHRLKLPEVRVEHDLMLAAYAADAGDKTDFYKVIQHELQIELNEESSLAAHFEGLLKLHDHLQEKLIQTQSVKLYSEIELPLMPILYQMERRGIKLDCQILKTQSDELGLLLQDLEKKIFEMAGETFNVASPKQLGQILFQKMGLPAIKKTKTGYSTDSDVLEKLEHPIAKHLIHWREYAKLKSTYLDALPLLVDEHERLHTELRQAMTTTGRLSSVNPNLQNIPIRTERGQRVRKAFVAEQGKKLLSVDYSQIELRVLAHISGDVGLIEAFLKNQDIHTATAAEIFDVELEQIQPEQRRVAKAVNFGIAYGQEVFGLANTLGIPRAEAQQIIQRYFERFSGVRNYIDQTIQTAHERGYVETLIGRKRYIPELRAKNPALKKFGERAAINAPVQGTASDLVKMAMIKLVPVIKSDLLLQIHDELIFEGTETELKEDLPKIVEVMEGIVQLKVPLKVNAAIGQNWDEAH